MFFDGVFDQMEGMKFVPEGTQMNIAESSKIMLTKQWLVMSH